MSDDSRILVSVCMPSYRSGKTIEDAVSSVLNQDVPLELILILDESDSATEETLKKYENDPRLRVLRNPARIGAAKSRNRAVKAARGTYIAFLDADDMWAKDKLKKQMEVLSRTGRVLCCTARELMTPEGKRTGRVIPVAETVSYRDLLRHNSINCSSVVVRREAALEYPMDHEDSHEDYITWLRILKQYGPAAGINEPLLYYRLSSTGKSGSMLRSAAMTWRVYRYMGFSLPRCVLCFISYAFCGVKKYGKSRL